MSSELIQKIQDFKGVAVGQIQAAKDLNALQQCKVEFLGKKGQLTEILKTLGQLSPEERKNIGQMANVVKDELQKNIEEAEVKLNASKVAEKIESERIDVTLPGLQQPRGSHHPVMQILHESREIFKRLGFDVCEGPEIETDYYNFEALNIPQNHPARDMQDTFYFPDGRLLRTHTSPVQVHVMERQKPPIAMVAPGVVYRHDYDQTHSPMFHQIEGLMVDTNIHFGHLKAIVQEFLMRIFERDLKFRFRPSFFQFTEPSAEVDMSCVFCNGAGCRVCKQTGWLEVMGCGTVDPAVFKSVDIDSQKYSGLAFGAGLERIAMFKYGINDLRLFFENDVRFLGQF